MEMKPVQGFVIVRLNDFDWYVGKNVEECIEQYMDDIGGDQDDLDSPGIISEDEANSLKWIDDPYSSSKRECSFLEHLTDMVAGNKELSCQPFASTEY